jgi:hypothetical protein
VLFRFIINSLLPRRVASPSLNTFNLSRLCVTTLLLPASISMTLKASPIFLLASDPIMIRLLPQSLLGWILSLQMKSTVIFLPMRCGSNIIFLPLSLPCQRLIFLPELQCHGAEVIVVVVATNIEAKDPSQLAMAEAITSNLIQLQLQGPFVNSVAKLGTLLPDVINVQILL